MNTLARIILMGAAHAAAIAAATAQGTLMPPGDPAPTQRSLQEIWERIGAVQTDIGSLQTQTEAIEDEVAALAAANPQHQQSLLLSMLQDELPWRTTKVARVPFFGTVLDTAMAVDPSGEPAIAFSDYTNPGNPTLRLARRSGSTWSVTTVHEGADNHIPSLAFDPEGAPAIAFLAAPNGQLAFAHFYRNNWSVSTVTGPVAGTLADARETRPSLAFGPDGHPAIAFHNPSTDDLQFVRFNGTFWQSSTIDTTGNTGHHPSLAFAPSGEPAIAYWDKTGEALRYARFTNRTTTGWSLSTVTFSSFGFELPLTLAFDRDGRAAIGYSEMGGGAPGSNTGFWFTPRVARSAGAGWLFWSVDASGGLVDPDFPFNVRFPSTSCSLAFGPDGVPAAVFLTGGSAWNPSIDPLPLPPQEVEFTPPALGFARASAGSWRPPRTLATRAILGAIAFGGSGQPMVSYVQVQGDDSYLYLTERYVPGS